MIFKKAYTKPIPPGAEFFVVKGVRFARWKDRAGRTHKAPLTGSGDRIRLESAKYYVRFKDADGIVHEVAGYTDYEATKVRESELLKRVERGQAGLVDPLAEHKRRRFGEHVAAFEGYLANKGNTAEYVTLTVQRVRDVLDGCAVSVVTDLSASRVSEYLAGRRRAGLSVASSNHYTRAIKGFCRWLIRDRRLSENPLEYLPMLRADADRRRLRRALSEAEVEALIQTTRAHGQIKEGLSGGDRAILYLLAVNTGLRAGELASLTRLSFDFEGNPATVRVLAGYSKHREEDVLPLRPDVAAAIRTWISDRPMDKRLWPGKWYERCNLIAADLAAAGVEYQDASGRYADFHALRHTFISRLARAGVHPKLAQDLARHRTLDMTMRVYTHSLQGDLTAALDKLPSLPSTETRAGDMALAATGTDDAEPPTISQKRKDQLALQLALKSDFACPDVASGGKTEGDNGAQAMCHKSLEKKILDNESQGMSKGVNNGGSGWVPVGLTDFKSGSGRYGVPGGFDSHTFPPISRGQLFRECRVRLDADGGGVGPLVTNDLLDAILGPRHLRA